MVIPKTKLPLLKGLIYKAPGARLNPLPFLEQSNKTRGLGDSCYMDKKGEDKMGFVSIAHNFGKMAQVKLRFSC